MALRCVVVTPERTELDREAEYIALPLYDGELGVMSGRAPMIGRLGHGTLRLQTAAGPEKYFIDGGFAQVENNVVNILTGKAIAVDLINGDQARQELEDAKAMPGSTPEESALKETALRKARGKVRISLIAKRTQRKRLAIPAFQQPVNETLPAAPIASAFRRSLQHF